VGLPKVASAAQAITAINPDVHVTALQARADAALLDTLVPQATVVLDCSDNYATRHAVNAACVRHGKPLVVGAVIRFDGQITVVDPRAAASPCYACVFPPDAAFEEVQCSTMGVFAPLVGVVGAMQAAEALKLLSGAGPSLAGRLLMLDGWAMEWNTMHLNRHPDCPVCSASK
jgi:molybdopterin/thiamine biosynthesis adenylyltransferase